jgi:hypothetical protein
MGIIATYCQDFIKAKDVNSVQNSDFLGVQAHGAYTNHSA